MRPKTGKKVRRAPWLKLYWCTTDDHDEDWFVVARRSIQAARFFRDYEGYDDDDVIAEFVCALPQEYQDDADCEWPTRELLEACGAKILRWETPRVVDLNGVRYAEGMLEHQICELTDDMLETHGRGRPNKTRRTSRIS